MATVAETEPQCMGALFEANRVRLSRAAIKAGLKAGGPREGVLAHPDVASARILEVLMWPSRWGRERARRGCLKAGLYEFKATGTLTPRQRRIVEELWVG